VDSGQKYYTKAGDAVFNQFENRNEPVFQRQEAALQTQLRNQGVRPGDETYDTQLAQMRQQQNDARTNASLEATKAAGTEAQRMYGMDSGARAQATGEIGQQGAFANSAAGQALAQNMGLNQQQFNQQATAAGFGNQAQGQQFQQNLTGANYQTQLRQQQIAEEMQKRGFSLNEINGLLNGQQIGMPNMPGFGQAGKADTTQYSNAAQQQYAAAQDAANASNATMGGIAKLAGGAMGFI
jgi:hypothetical protein